MGKKKDIEESYYGELSKEDIKQLEELLKEINEEAKKVVEDYTKHPSEISGSFVQIHQNSPFLKD
jgi:vacuolar-type H+-ATPase subunit H